MLIRYFRSSYYSQYIVLLILAIVLWIKAFFEPCILLQSDDQSPLFTLLAEISGVHPIVMTSLGFIILLANAIILNAILINHELLPKNSLLGAFIYIVFMSQSPAVLGLNPVLLASFFLIPAFNRILNTFGKADPTQDVFSASFLIAMASLFYFPSILFFLILLFSFMVFGTFSIRIILVAFSGLIAVYLYLALYYFVTDQLEDQMLAYMNYFLNTHAIVLPKSFHLYISWGLQFIVFVAALAYIFSHLKQWNISVRRKATLIFWLAILSLGSITLEGNSIAIAFTLAVIPFSALLGVYWGALRKPPRSWELFMWVVLLYTLLNNAFIGPC